MSHAKDVVNENRSDRKYVPYLTRKEYQRMKMDAILNNKPMPDGRGIEPHPKMATHILNMQPAEINRRTNGGSYSKKKYGRTPGTTKKNLSKRGKAVRVNYNYILDKESKVACITYIKGVIANANFSDQSKAKEIEERLINKALQAKPNTTLVLNRKRKLTITFTTDMFKRNISSQI